MDEQILKLSASFEDGKLIIERQDGKPIKEFGTGECVEVLEFGSNGNAVRALQALLNCKGYAIAIDGIFGNQTQEALNKFCGSYVCNSYAWEKLIRS